MKRGFILINIGSPPSPTPRDVRKYLSQFLMDPCVIEQPWLVRAALVYGIILPTHTRQAVAAYRRIWTPDGSPLVRATHHLANQLEIEIGLLHSTPSIFQALENLLQKGVEEIVLLPLFPQSAPATTQSIIKIAKKAVRQRARLKIIPPFYKHPAFIKPLANLLQESTEHILFSYHGLPLKQLKKMDTPDYKFQCLETTKALVEAANIPKERYSIAFQSRMGHAEWIKPYTSNILQKLPSLGIKKLAVICPSFFCDNLETLDEINHRGRKLFLAAGGDSFRLIPALNDSPAGFQCLEKLIQESDRFETLI